jgi:hypothetical protein
MTDESELTPAAHDVLEERRRQVEKGYAANHDNQHDAGELPLAAAAYAEDAAYQVHTLKFGDTDPAWADGTRDLDNPPASWPWGDDWKPSTPRRNLVRAAALLLAEIERLDRAAAKVEQAS